MPSGLHDLWASISTWWQGLDARGILLFVGEKLFEGLLQAMVVVVIGWLVVYRQWRQLTQGRSDQVIFSANLFTPLDEPADQPSADGDAVSAPAPNRPAAQDGRPAPGQCGAAPSSCVTWPNRPRWSTRSSPPKERPASRSSTTLSTASREAWHRHRFGADQWLMAVTCEDRQGRPQMLHPRAPRSPRRPRAHWHPGSGAAGTSWSRRGITTGELSRSTRSPPLPGGASAAGTRERPGHQGRTSCRWSIARRIIPGFASCRWASTSKSPSSNRPFRSTGSDICRRSRRWG